MVLPARAPTLLARAATKSTLPRTPMRHLDLLARWTLSVCCFAIALGLFVWLLNLPGVHWHRFTQAMPYLALAVLVSVLWLNRPGT